MPYCVEYFNQRVLDEIESWPVGILADYERMVELLIEFGPVLKMPRCRAMGAGSLSFALAGVRGSGGRCTAS